MATQKKSVKKGEPAQKSAAQNSVFKMALPFVITVTLLLLAIIAVIGVMAIADQKQRQAEEGRRYQRQVVAIVNNYLDQQNSFVQQLANQPSEIIVGKTPGALLTRVVLTGEDIPGDLSFSNQDVLRRALAQHGNLVPEVSFSQNKEGILAMVKPLADGKGVLLVNLPLDLLRKNMDVLAKQAGGMIRLSQKLGVDGESNVIINLGGDAIKTAPAISVNQGIWALQVEPPSGQGIVVSIVIVLLLAGAIVVYAMVRLVKKFDHTISQDMTAIQSMLKGEAPATPLNFSFTENLQGTLVAHKVVQANLEKKEQEKADKAAEEPVEGLEMTKVDMASLIRADQASAYVADEADMLDLSSAKQGAETPANKKDGPIDLAELEFTRAQKAKEDAALQVPPQIFRAYDIRGKADAEITVALAKDIGLAIGSEARNRGEKTIVVGRDARLSSEKLGKALVEGLRASGCDVLDVGQVPTPVLYYAAKNIGSGNGVMVTASHNPAPDNGFKIMLANHTLVDHEIAALRERILAKDYSKGAGGYAMREIADAYLHDLNEDVILARNFSVVVDAGNGVAGPLAVRMLEALGCTVSPLYCEPDGNFPNHDPDPTKAANLEDLLSDVAISGADLGIALDGDGDRVVIVTNSTKVVPSDKLLMLFAKDILATQPGADILFDVKCSRDLVGVITGNGGRPVMTKSGHSWLKAGIEETGAPLAGEMSGHFFFNDRWGGFDDGLYAAARFLEILANTYDGTADDLFAEFPNRSSTPEIRIPVAEDHKHEVIDSLIGANAEIANAVVNTTDGLRVEFPDAWGLVRASNTGPYLTARFEANDAESLQRIKEFFKGLLQKADAMLLLPF